MDHVLKAQELAKNASLLVGDLNEDRPGHFDTALRVIQAEALASIALSLSELAAASQR